MKKKKLTSNINLNWLLWWRQDEEELRKQVKNYSSLKVTRSYRGVATLLLLLSSFLTLIFSLSGTIEKEAIFDAVILGVLSFFVYKGQRWAIIAAMVVWTIEKGYTLVMGDSPVMSIVWWLALMSPLFGALKVEQVRRKQEKIGEPSVDVRERYAGFWIRLGAFVIDLAIVYLFQMLLLIIGIDWPDSIDILVNFLTIFFYHLFFLSSYSSTPGKMLFGLAVVDEKSQKQIQPKVATIRTLSYLASGLFLGAGFIIIAFKKNKQGWHDRIARTLVVKKEKKLLLPILLAIVSLIFIAWIIYSGYSEDYYYLPTQSSEAFRKLDEFLLDKPENFQQLLSSVSSADQDYEVAISESTALKTPEEIVEKYGDAVVLVASEDSFGSGFIIRSDGLIVTNYHVVEDANKVAITLINGDNYFVSSVVDYDQIDDVILLKIDGRNLPTIPIGDSNKIKVAEEIIVIGNPEGLSNSVSKGIVSSIDREFEGIDYIQVDAPISAGSSGGPIVNNRGEAIAISTFYYIEGQNLNFGLPINTIFDLELGNILKGQVIKEGSQPQTVLVQETPASNRESLPSFDPEIYSCRNMPAPAKIVNSDGSDVSWQTSAPRSSLAKTFPGDIVEIGLRNKYGSEEDIFYYTVRVQNPDGSAATSDSIVFANDFSSLFYPNDFPGGDTSQKGIYTVLYQVRGEIITCDGFVVE